MASLDDLTKSRIRRALKSLSLRSRPVAAYLFGSRAEGCAGQWSDYDLAVFIEGAEKWDMTQHNPRHSTSAGRTVRIGRWGSERVYVPILSRLFYTEFMIENYG